MWLKFQPFRGDLWYGYQSRFVSIHTDRVDSSGNKIVQKRNIISNSHNGEKDIPCVLYYYCIEDENNELWARDQFATSVVVLENYHEVKKKAKSGKTYTVLAPCKGKDRFGNVQCQICDSGVPVVYGTQKHWSVWSTIKKSVDEQLAALSTRCVSCKQGEVSTFGYSCNACGEKLASHYDGRISDEDIEAYETAEVECPSCSHVGKADKMVECLRHLGDDQYENGCDSPKTIPEGVNPWDCEVRVKFDKVGNATSVTIVDWRPHDASKLGGRFDKPMDLEYALGWMDLEDQAKAMGRVNPFDKGAQKALEDYFTAKPGEDDENSVSW